MSNHERPNSELFDEERGCSPRPLPSETTALLSASHAPYLNESTCSNGSAIYSHTSMDDSTRSRMSLQTDLANGIEPLPGMQIRAHRIASSDKKKKKKGIQSDGSSSLSSSLIPCTPSDALEGAKSNMGDQYWVDIDADPQHADELREWLHRLHLPQFVVDMLAEEPETWASQVIPLRGAFLAVVRILPYDQESDDIAHLAALLLRNILITFTSCPRADTAGLYESALEQMRQPERIPSPTGSGAFIAWLRFHLERTSRSTRDLRRHLLAMDEAMDREVTTVRIQEIIDIKDQLLRLLSVAEEQSECLEAFSAAIKATDNPGISFTSVMGTLASLDATAAGTERLALRLEKHVNDLRQRSEQHEHTIMNRRLAVLTVLSAIFLPLTLLTGIWGMNFEESK